MSNDISASPLADRIAALNAYKEKAADVVGLTLGVIIFAFGFLKVLGPFSHVVSHTNRQ